MNLKTKINIINEIKNIDPETDITTGVIDKLTADGLIRAMRRGNRVYYDLEILIEDLSNLFGLDSKNKLPRVRTIYKAYSYTAKHSMGISRSLLFTLGQKDYISSLHLGERTYIPLEVFEEGYSEKFTKCIFECKKTPKQDDLCCTVISGRNRRIS